MTSESATENVDEKRDNSVPEKQGDQPDLLEQETCTMEAMTATPQLVSEKEYVSKTQEAVGQQGKKRPCKCKHVKKLPI